MVLQKNLDVISAIDIEPTVEKIDPKEKDAIEQLKRESKRMWLTDQFVKRPISVLIVGYATLILMTYLSVQLEYFEISDSAPRDFLIWDDPMTVDLDMFNVANEYMDEKIG